MIPLLVSGLTAPWSIPEVPALFSGIGVVPFALGVFAVTQMVVLYGMRKSVAGVDFSLPQNVFLVKLIEEIADTFNCWYRVARALVTASLLSLAPGLGTSSFNFILCGMGQRVPNTKGQFKLGVPEATMSAEGSPLSKEMGSLIPSVVLGLPIGPRMIVLLAAVTILGHELDPSLLKSLPSLPYSMMWVMVIAGVLSSAVGFLLGSRLAEVTRSSGPFLFPFTVTLAILGSFSYSNTTMSVYLLAVFGMLAVINRDLDYSAAFAAIGLFLVGSFDDDIHLTDYPYGWGFLKKSSLADIFILITIISVIFAGRRWHKYKGKFSLVKCK